MIRCFLSQAHRVIPLSFSVTWLNKAPTPHQAAPSSIKVNVTTQSIKGCLMFTSLSKNFSETQLEWMPPITVSLYWNVRHAMIQKQTDTHRTLTFNPISGIVNWRIHLRLYTVYSCSNIDAKRNVALPRTWLWRRRRDCLPYTVILSTVPTNSLETLAPRSAYRLF